MKLAKPYGTYWENMKEPQWRAFHYNQSVLHEHFDIWYNNAPPFDTILEVGCGHGEQARLTFGGHKYTGIDLGSGIDIARNHKMKDPLHEFIKGDVMTVTKLPKHDLVFSINVIDHVPSPNAFIDKLISLANKQVIIYSYNGYDEVSDDHTIKVNGTGDCYLNILSAKELKTRYPNAKITRLASTTIVSITVS